MKNQSLKKELQFESGIVASSSFASTSSSNSKTTATLGKRKNNDDPSSSSSSMITAFNSTTTTFSPTKTQSPPRQLAEQENNDDDNNNLTTTPTNMRKNPIETLLQLDKSILHDTDINSLFCTCPDQQLVGAKPFNYTHHGELIQNSISGRVCNGCVRLRSNVDRNILLAHRNRAAAELSKRTENQKKSLYFSFFVCLL